MALLSKTHLSSAAITLGWPYSSFSIYVICISGITASKLAQRNVREDNSSFRGSILTNVLSDFVGGNGKATFVLHVDPSERSLVPEIQRALGFGEILGCILNRVRKNEIHPRFESLEMQCFDLERYVAQLQEEMKKVQSTLANLEVELSERETLISQLEDDCSRLQQTHSQEREQQQKRIEEMVSEHQKQRKALDEVHRGAVFNLQIRLQEAQQDVAEGKAREMLLKFEAELKSKESAYETAHLKELGRQVEALQALLNDERDTAQQEIQRLSVICENLKVRKYMTVENILATRDRKYTHTRKLQSRNADLEAKSNNLLPFPDRLARLETEYERLLAKYESTCNELQTLQQQWEQSIAELKVCKSDLEQSKTECEKLRQASVEEKARAEELRQQLEKERTRIEDLWVTLDQKLEEKGEKVTTEVRKMYEEKLHKAESDARAQQHTFEKNLASLQADLAKSKEEKQAADMEKDGLKKEVQTLKTQLDDMKASWETEKREWKAQEQELKQSEKQRTQESRLTLDQLTAIKKQMENLQKEFNNQKKELEDARKPQKVDSSNNDFQMKWLEGMNELRKQNAELKGQLESLRDHLGSDSSAIGSSQIEQPERSVLSEKPVVAESSSMNKTEKAKKPKKLGISTTSDSKSDRPAPEAKRGRRRKDPQQSDGEGDEKENDNTVGEQPTTNQVADTSKGSKRGKRGKSKEETSKGPAAAPSTKGRKRKAAQAAVENMQGMDSDKQEVAEDDEGDGAAPDEGPIESALVEIEPEINDEMEEQSDSPLNHEEEVEDMAQEANEADQEKPEEDEEQANEAEEAKTKPAAKRRGRKNAKAADDAPARKTNEKTSTAAEEPTRKRKAKAAAKSSVPAVDVEPTQEETSVASAAESADATKKAGGAAQPVKKRKLGKRRDTGGDEVEAQTEESSQPTPKENVPPTTATEPAPQPPAKAPPPATATATALPKTIISTTATTNTAAASIANSASILGRMGLFSTNPAQLASSSSSSSSWLPPRNKPKSVFVDARRVQALLGGNVDLGGGGEAGK
ncbi:hypothetical protein HK102_008664, partial [Quaeritorhiza haematococci]